MVVEKDRERCFICRKHQKYRVGVFALEGVERMLTNTWCSEGRECTSAHRNDKVTRCSNGRRIALLDRDEFAIWNKYLCRASDSPVHAKT